MFTFETQLLALNKKVLYSQDLVGFGVKDRVNPSARSKRLEHALKVERMRVEHGCEVTHDEILKKLSPARRKKITARAAELIAEEMALRKKPR